MQQVFTDNKSQDENPSHLLTVSILKLFDGNSKNSITINILIGLRILNRKQF